VLRFVHSRCLALRYHAVPRGPWTQHAAMYRNVDYVYPLMHKVAKIVTQNNGVRRHTGLTHGF